MSLQECRSPAFGDAEALSFSEGAHHPSDSNDEMVVPQNVARVILLFYSRYRYVTYELGVM